MKGKIGQDISSKELKEKESMARSSQEDFYRQEVPRASDDERVLDFGFWNKENVSIVLASCFTAGVLYGGYKMGVEGVSAEEVVPTDREELKEFASKYGMDYSAEASEVFMENTQEAVEVFSGLF